MLTDAYTLGLDGRFRSWFAKQRILDLQRAKASGDLEGINQAMGLISGCLGPESLRGVSQFAMRDLMTVCAPRYAALKDTIREITDKFDSTALTDATSRLSAFESAAGRVHIWIQRPQFAVVEALARAALNQEQDFPDYLAHIRRSQFGLENNELDAYIAMIILGMRKEGGELVLPGDMVVKRRRQDLRLEDVSEAELLPLLLNLARKRKRSYGEADGMQRHRDQLSKFEAMLAAKDADAWGHHRWTARITVDWEAIANQLDPRTAAELRMTRDGFSVEEMGKNNYEHFRTKLPAIRKLIIDDSLHKMIKVH